MTLYEFVIIKDEKLDKDGNVVSEAEVVYGPTTLLARNEEQATLMAARRIPEENMDDIDLIKVVVRPFEAEPIEARKEFFERWKDTYWPQVEASSAPMGTNTWTNTSTTYSAVDIFANA